MAVLKWFFVFVFCNTAPEDLKKPRISSKASDIWQFGVMIWELASLGARPFGQLQPQTEKSLLFELRMFAFVECVCVRVCACVCVCVCVCMGVG